MRKKCEKMRWKMRWKMRRTKNAKKMRWKMRLEMRWTQMQKVAMENAIENAMDKKAKNVRWKIPLTHRIFWLQLCYVQSGNAATIRADHRSFREKRCIEHPINSRRGTFGNILSCKKKPWDLGAT